MDSFSFAPHETRPGVDLVKVIKADSRTKEDLAAISGETMRFIHGRGGRAIRIAIERAIWEQEEFLLRARTFAADELNDLNFATGFRAGLMGVLSYLRQFDNPDNSPLLNEK